MRSTVHSIWTNLEDIIIREMSPGTTFHSPDTLDVHSHVLAQARARIWNICTNPITMLSLNKYLFMPEISSVPSGDLLSFSDCAEILQSGVTDNGVYVIRHPNSTQTVKVVAALQRLLTFSCKYHLIDCDTKYIYYLNHSTSLSLHVAMLTHINASRWHL